MTILEFHLREQPPMPLSWQDRLNAASSESEVLGVARDFIAQFSPQEIQLLPEVCRPRKFVDSDDIASYAFTLVRHNCESDERTSLLVHKLVAFFANASTRLSQVLDRPHASEDDTRQSA
jgi:hypothetical protein